MSVNSVVLKTERTVKPTASAEALEALEVAGHAGRAMLTSGMAAEVLGLSADQVRGLGMEPDGTYLNEYRKTCSLYRTERVLAMYEDPRVVRARWRRTGARDWESVFRRAYGDTKHALLDAAGAMFELNRYAKGAGRDLKDRIYDLKDRFLRHLWELGHCVSVHRYRKDVPKRQCLRCDGTGCDRCDHTGIFEEAGTLEFLSFRFEIEGQRFAWHRPEGLAAWVPEERIVDEPDADWEPGMIASGDWPSMGFAKAYALIEWVLGDDGQD